MSILRAMLWILRTKMWILKATMWTLRRDFAASLSRVLGWRVGCLRRKTLTGSMLAERCSKADSTRTTEPGSRDTKRR
eukprot:7321640-Pyramimonas_sp.AAC.1